ncbi:hypothetical protein MTP03_08970 [Tsukamurella sp. PLM1]|nr:hypothetical protein MTP03_08970 [Tsukamurella sp. PLM1]
MPSRGSLAWDVATLQDVRNAYKGETDLCAAVEYAMGKGWTVRKQGHKFRLYCPCGGDLGKQFGLGGTVRNSTATARRVRRTVDRCPDRHDLI